MTPFVRRVVEARVALGHPILVGESPERHGDPEKPLHGDCGRQLALLCGVRFPTPFVRIFGRVNLLDYWPGPAIGGGSHFPHDEGRLAAAELLTLCRQRSRLVLLGRRVALSFGFGESVPWFEWQALVHKSAAVGLTEVGIPPPVHGVVVPCPARTAKFWNDAECVAAARRFWISLAASCPAL